MKYKFLKKNGRLKICFEDGTPIPFVKHWENQNGRVYVQARMDVPDKVCLQCDQGCLSFNGQKLDGIEDLGIVAGNDPWCAFYVNVEHRKTFTP